MLATRQRLNSEAALRCGSSRSRVLERQRVLERTSRGDEILGIVRGTREYDVRVYATSRGRLEAVCTCADDCAIGRRRVLCKHTLALALDHRDAGEAQPTHYSDASAWRRDGSALDILMRSDRGGMKIAGHAIPTVARLDRVVAFVRAAVDAERWSHEGETFAALASAANILGWLSFQGRPTPRGFAMAACPDAGSELVHAGVALERSAVGKAWLAYCGVRFASELTSSSATELLQAHAALTSTEVARRAKVLRRWLGQIRGAMRQREAVAHEIRSGEPTLDEMHALAAFLSRSCEGIVSTSVLTWARANRIVTLRDLALSYRDALAAEPVLGRKTLLAVDALFHRTGRSWRAVCELIDSSPVFAEDWPSPHDRRRATPLRPRSDWDTLRDAIPQELHALPIVRIDPSRRVRNVCEELKLRTVGDLVAQSESTLLEQENFGRGSVAELVTCLRALARRVTEHGDTSIVAPGLDHHGDWLALLRARIERLPELDRQVLVRRCGIDGSPPQTLYELGRQLRVTAERIRQIETRAIGRLAEDWWPEPMQTRLRELLDGGVAGIAQIARDPFFAHVEAHIALFAYVLERVVDPELRILELGGRWLVAMTTQQQLDAWLAAIRRELASLAFPIAEAAVIEIVARHVPMPALAPDVQKIIRDHLAIVDAPGGPIVLGLRDRRVPAVLAHLHASPTPVPIAELDARYGSGAFPDEVIFVGRRMVALPRHVPGFAEWMPRLIPGCIEIMAGGDPARQWAAAELIRALADRMEVPAWLAPGHLAAMVRIDGRLRYLGRMYVALGHDDAPSDRTYLVDLLVEILQEHGGPLTRAELLAAVRCRASCRALSFQGTILHAPFVPLDERRVGLIERDVPGGHTAMEAAAAILEDALKRTHRALFPREALRAVQALGGDHASWTTSMISAAARNSPALVVNFAGSIGPAGTPADQLPTRQSTVRELLAASHGRVDLATTRATLWERFARSYRRNELGKLAQTVGARLDGDHIVDARLVPARTPGGGEEEPELR